jgi:hypothetical protein
VRLLEALEESDVLIDGDTSINYLGADVWKLRLESLELLLDLISKLSVVAKNECRQWLQVVLKLMKNGENKNCGLSHAGLGLAKDVNANHSLRDALLLHF